MACTGRFRKARTPSNSNGTNGINPNNKTLFGLVARSKIARPITCIKLRLVKRLE